MLGVAVEIGLSQTANVLNSGATHGVILTAWAIASVCGGLIFTAVYNAQKILYPRSIFKW